MKRILLTALFAIAGPSLLFGQSHRTMSAKGTGAEQEIKKEMEELTQAQLKADTATLNRLLADGYTMTNPFGQVLPKAETLSNLKSGTLKFQEMKADDVNVTMFGDTAVAHARMTVKGQRSGQDIGGQYQSTWVWVKNQGRWQAVSGQATAIAGTSMASQPRTKSKAED